MLEKITPLQFSKTFCLAILGLLMAFPIMAQKKPELKIGGALRFNYIYRFLYATIFRIYI